MRNVSQNGIEPRTVWSRNTFCPHMHVRAYIFIWWISYSQRFPIFCPLKRTPDDLFQSLNTDHAGAPALRVLVEEIPEYACLKFACYTVLIYQTVKWGGRTNRYLTNRYLTQTGTHIHTQSTHVHKQAHRHKQSQKHTYANTHTQKKWNRVYTDAYLQPHLQKHTQV